MIPTNADCLIYNSFGSGTGRRFIKHILKSVFWDEVKGVNTINMGTTAANSIEMYTNRKPEYVSPQEWILSTIEEIENHFTFQIGDMLILATSQTLISPNEFTSDVQINNYFGTNYTHRIMSIDEKKLPNRQTSHFEIAGA